ncbi:DUF4041 domain-containing protein [Hymenobacter defluvii]|uniref:DUF4041 domain-containing protein n=1 Tax=Hymenobacter defluvii TaxID=2054411 RepID=A0ABS3THR1_9BACT|nr:DUF4041 domain-containing protein [Hymenobacter defluvii]MBO3273191.1 DUF4041 domain-containing protein [Hymenobacter defluvii]
MSTLSILALLCAALAAGVFLLFRRLGAIKSAHATLQKEHVALTDRFRPIVDVDAEKQRVEAQTAQLAQEYQQQQKDLGILKVQVNELHAEFESLEESAELRSFGLYKPRYDFATSAHYQQKLNDIYGKQKKMISDKKAATCSIEWTVNGSKVEGRKQINQTLRLTLRAFNGECDAAISKVKYSNIVVMETRIRKAFDAINKMVEIQQCTIARGYLELRLQELYLCHEYQEKVQAEKELQRQIREQMREEELAQRELEKARLDAEKEEKRYADALKKAQREVEQATGEKQEKLLAQILELQSKLEIAQQVKARAISQAQLTRCGHVYVISNIGSFGEDVYKIGMTRRLDPLDRVKELGDASVPFQFDVHAVIYCEDAPKLENTLHRLFHHRRLNRINERKEFFKVTLQEIADAVRANHGAIEFLHEAEAVEYRKTLALLTENISQQ